MGVYGAVFISERWTGRMADFLSELAEVQSQIADLRTLAKEAPFEEIEAIRWLADQLEVRAREIDAMA
jgi:hypothetical protein